MNKLITSLIMSVFSIICNAAPTITSVKGWFESGYITWATSSDATTYTVYVRPEGGTYTKLDKELIRNYGTYGRADAIGLKAGKYQFKVEDSNGSSAESDIFTAAPHDRNGFAHVGMTGGIGAYKNDGTLKDNARVLYVTAANAKTVSLDVITSSNGRKTTGVGLQDIVYLYQKGYDTTPLDIRIIGTIKAADMDRFDSSEEGLQVKGKAAYTEMPITVEGVGNDAAIHGFGILVRNCKSTEFRNFAIMLCMDDCLSLDTENCNVWIHNMDFFYGGTGGDADQAKGDGTVDIKGKSKNVTVSYNHFYDAGKCSLGGMKGETTDCWMTYHHNWFDHSDSRHPRIRTAFYHVYNNYFDGNSKYGVGCTSGGSAFVESNYFRNCKYPMLISKQGTDAESDKGTFSGEEGGVIKAFGNVIRNPRQILFYDGTQTNGKWDAVKVDSRSASVAATAYSGGTPYNTAADQNAIAAVPESAIDNAEDIPAIVRGELGAGRCGHGDFTWTFSNAAQDANYGVIADLKSAIVGYKSTLVSIFGEENLPNGGATSPVDGGDGKGIDQATNDKVIPVWGAGGDTPEEPDFEEEPFIASADNDLYWVGENAAQTDKYIADGTITIANGTATNKDGIILNSGFKPSYAGNDTYPAEHIGSLQLGQASAAGKTDGASATFYCPDGVTSFKLNTLRTGTTYYIVQKSTDGINYSTVATVEKAPVGIVTKDFSMTLRNTESTDPVWVRIINTSTGGLNIHGIQINQLAGSSATLQPNDIKATNAELSLSIGSTYTLSQGTGYTTSSDADVSYTTNKPSVATVAADGTITAVGEGEATVIISQAKNEVYKAGTATVKVAVTDPRTASALTLTSAPALDLKAEQTSLITASGAEGALTYSTSNPAVATVDPTGMVTAVAAGKATITVSDQGSATVKPGTQQVEVTVTKDMSGVEICQFTGNKPSSSNVSVSGNYSTSKGTVTYEGTAYGTCVKIESATAITITPPADCHVTLILDTANKKIKIDGSDKTTGTDKTYTFDATAGQTYKLTKTDTMNLFLIIFEYGVTDSINSINSITTPAPANTQMYDINGRRISNANRGQIVIINGKKIMGK